LLSIQGRLALFAQSLGDAIVPKILLVEDNEVNRDMLRRRLENKGYVVVPAEDGEQ